MGGRPLANGRSEWWNLKKNSRCRPAAAAADGQILNKYIAEVLMAIPAQLILMTGLEPWASGSGTRSTHWR
jgi:hypothetical protein